MTDTDITALVARLREAQNTDHERGCQGREYTCSCGWDDRIWAAAIAAADALEALQAEVENQRKEAGYWHHRYTEVCMGFSRPLDPWANVPEDEGFDGPQGAE